jgi:Mg/Co/Ni transporter MgtE
MTDLPETSKQFQELLAREAWDEFGLLFERESPDRIAQLLEPLDDDTIVWAVLRRLPPPRDGEVLGHFDLERQVRLIDQENPREVAVLIQQMPSEARANLFQRLDEQTRSQIRRHMG